MKSIGWILLFIGFFLLGYCPLKESDTFMYMSLARGLFNTGHFPSQDPYILSMPGSEWRVTYEWAGFVFYYISYLAAGFTGLVIAKIAVASIAWGPAVCLVWRYFRDSLAHYILFVVGLIAFGMRFSERTSLLGDTLFLLTLAIVICDWKGWPRIRWFIPLIALLWVNCHGSFPLVWVACLMWLGGLVFTGDAKGALQRLPVFFGALLTPLINPEGWRGITYPFEFMRYKTTFLENINLEWQFPFSPQLLLFNETYYLAAFLILAAVYFTICAFRDHSRQTLPYYGMALFFLLIGLWANRFISTSVLGLCLLSVAIPNPWRPRVFGSHWVMTAMSLVLVLSLLTGVYVRTGFPQKIGTGIDYRMFPSAKTIQVLKDLPERGPVWNSYYLGCYLAWELEEKKKFFIHGFVIDIAIFQRYFSGIGFDKDHFDQVTNQYNVNEMLVHKDFRSIGIMNILKVHPGWYVATQDEVSVLFERR